MTDESDRIARLEAENAALRARVVGHGGGRDAETGLADAERFAEELKRSIALADRHGTPAALLDILVADPAALPEIARLLAGLIRGGDVLARTGPDRLGLILAQLDHNSAIETAERLARCAGPGRIAIGTATILPGDAAEDIRHRAERSREAGAE